MCSSAGSPEPPTERGAVDKGTLTIIALAGACYLVRVAGYWAAARYRLPVRLQAFVEALPVPLLSALVVSAVVQAGLPALAALAVTGLAMAATRSELGAAVAGVAALAVIG